MDLKKNSTFWTWVITVVTLTTILIVLPPIHLKFNVFGRNIDRIIGGYSIDWHIGSWRFERDLTIQRGLDLAGGVRAVLQTDMSEIAEEDKSDALSSAQAIIERRVNFLGVSEANVFPSQAGEEYRIIVELPGVTDSDEALATIGQTAQLIFKELKEDAEVSELGYLPEDFNDTELTGKHLKRASVIFNATQQSSLSAQSEPQVRLQFNDEGAGLFEVITERNIGKRLAIFLDDQLLSAPVVSEKIPGGEAIINGGFTIEFAQSLVRQLNAGALPVPVEVVEQEVIGPTLGQESVDLSIKAGLIGLGLVVFFMIAYYGRLGVIAAFALILYALISLSVYKLVPITLTLSGIAGFVLSIGMAVDSNILIFERMKEERRMGRPLRQAMELGFGRAWDSIRDANIATLLVVFILFNPFNWNFFVSSGMVRGFALTLGIGILISLFTGIIVTRTLVRVFYKERKKNHA